MDKLNVTYKVELLQEKDNKCDTVWPRNDAKACEVIICSWGTSLILQPLDVELC